MDDVVPQRLGFDLADAFAGYCERLADFFELVLGAVFETEAHLDETRAPDGSVPADKKLKAIGETPAAPFYPPVTDWRSAR